MRAKTVYVNNVAIGEAATWDEVEELLRSKSIKFESEPETEEGPKGFFIRGVEAKSGSSSTKPGRGAA